MTGHETGVSKFKKCKIIASIFSDYSGMKLEINNNRTDEISTNMWTLTKWQNSQTTSQRKKSKGKLNSILNENGNTAYQNKAVLRRKFSAKCTYQEIRKK